MKTYAAIVIAIFVLFIGVNAAFAAGENVAPVDVKPQADPAPAPEPTPTPAPAPAPDGAGVPLPSAQDLVNILKGANEDDAKRAMDALVAKGEDAIQPLLDLQASGDAVGAPRATETLKRLGCVDGVYVVARLFHKEFEPYETIGIQFYFRNFTKNVVSVLNPVLPTDPEKSFDLGWKMTLKSSDGREMNKIDMNEGIAAAQTTATDFITLQPAGQPGESYNDVMHAQSLFGFERLELDEYTIEAEYYCKPDFAVDVKKRNDLKLENFFDKNAASPPMTFKVIITGMAEVSPEKAAQIKKNIEDLGSSDYQTWTDAEKALADVGPSALPLLREAVHTTNDPQIRYKAEQLIARIVKPVEEKVTYIGIRMDVMYENGIKIQGIMPESPAARGGLMEGDVIVKVGDFPLQGTTVQRVGYLRKYVQAHRESDKVELTVQRGESERKITIELARIPKQVFGQP